MARVVVVGTGIAGLITAYRASRNHEVVLVTKAELAESNTKYAQGGIAAALFPDDSAASHIADTMRAGAGLFAGDTQARRLTRLYGTLAEGFLGSAASAADLGEDFGHGLTAAEVDYLIAHEWARSADDVLWRRTKLGLHFSAEEAARLSAYITERITPA